MGTRTIRVVLATTGALAVGLALACTLTACGTAGAPPATTSAASSTAASEPSTAPIDMGGGSASTANAPVGMNQPTKSGDWGLTVTKLEFAAQAGGATAGSGQELAVLTLELTNTSTKDAGIGPSAFKFAGTNGVTYQAASTSSSQFIFNTPQPFKAGEKRTVKIAYEVDAGAKGGLLTFSPFSESGSATPAIINVN